MSCLSRRGERQGGKRRAVPGAVRARVRGVPAGERLASGELECRKLIAAAQQHLSQVRGKGPRLVTLFWRSVEGQVLSLA